ncbi:MAG: hypothetical protein ACRDRV_19985, partial [Pseudonocardiaceae bacterium]
YGIDIVLASAAWHLDHGSLLPGAVDKLRRARSSALNAVEPEFGLLVDGFALPPTRLRAPIAQDDYISVITHPLGGRIAPTAT